MYINILQERLVRNEEGELEVEHADRHHRVFLAKVRAGGVTYPSSHQLCTVCCMNLLCL
jgi:hypothetical protein